MKIIQLITELFPAGAEQIVLNLSKELKQRGYDIAVISLEPLPEHNTFIIDELYKENIPVHSLNLTKLTPWRIFKLLKILKNKSRKNIKPSPSLNKSKLVLHAHLIHANLAARFIKIFLKKQIKVINTIHIAEKRAKKQLQFILDRLSFPLCDIQTAVSDAARMYHAKKSKIPKERIKVVYNGILPPNKLKKKDAKQFLQKWDLKKCSKIIGSIGRLDWQKGYDIFLENLDSLGKYIPENETWGVVLIGEGPEKNKLRGIINNLHNKNMKIVLPGYIENAAAYISIFDIFIMPSRYEGFGLTLIEAMAHGLPILSSNVDSLPELIKDYELGTTIDFSTEDFAKEIQRQIYTEEKKPYFKHTIKEMTENYLKLYKKI